MKYIIYPAIGFARIGDSPEMFVGPETIGSHGTELDTGAQVSQFKDGQFKVRKQAARFHLYQQDNNGPIVPAALPQGAVISWNVSLANRKDAVIRNGGEPPATVAEAHAVDIASRANRVIAASDSIASTAGTAAIKPLSGTHAGSLVKLGELRVDAQGRLLVLGGSMISESHPDTPLTTSFYVNPNWHDDVSDGPVSASIQFPAGNTETAAGAWVIVTPPDFAPGAQPIVTMYDEILQVAIFNFGMQIPAHPSFTNDIYPIIRNARSLGWVHRDVTQANPTNESNWTQISENYALLGAPGGTNQALRKTDRDLVKNVRKLLNQYVVPSWKLQYLDAWVQGTFTSDWQGVPAVATVPSPESLTRSALEGAVGQGFYPGIEAGRILTDPAIYATPFDFRIAPNALRPGDVTALMAQPWQSDFLKCRGNWWPTQRPDLAPQPGGTFEFWQRPIAKGDHAGMVKNVKRLGMIVVNVDANGVQVSAFEQGRDPSL